jgi:transketolase
MANNMLQLGEGNSRQAFMDVLLEAAKADENIIVLTSDATGSAALGKIAAQLPAQFVECGIAEQNMVGIAAGIASFGKRPFVCAPAAFLSARSFEQIKVDVAYSANNVKLIGVSGGVSYGALGETHYSVQDFAAMRAVAGIVVLCPSDPVQAASLADILAKSDEPAYLRMGRGNIPIIYDEYKHFKIGKAIECRTGRDVTIVATGEQVYQALCASEQLKKMSISSSVLDMFTVKPIDKAAVVKAAKETGCVVTVEEHCIHGGLGSAVAQVLGENYPVPLKCLALPNEMLLCGSPAEIKDYYGINADGIVKAVLDIVCRKKYEC